jgi:hypothetical protein
MTQMASKSPTMKLSGESTLGKRENVTLKERAKKIYSNVVKPSIQLAFIIETKGSI